MNFELLIIPAFWWHQVYSLDNSNHELNISVNFWSKPPISQFLTPLGRRLAAQITTLLKRTFSRSFYIRIL
ncbi:cupin-like domain-containing protein [Nostoc sp.]|uniref:cupin-like domain-containing protein n=1 Tax=Nostoc sp. TaxID=1180 RepID=UPI003FA57811